MLELSGMKTRRRERRTQASRLAGEDRAVLRQDHHADAVRDIHWCVFGLPGDRSVVADLPDRPGVRFLDRRDEDVAGLQRYGHGVGHRDETEEEGEEGHERFRAESHHRENGTIIRNGRERVGRVDVAETQKRLAGARTAEELQGFILRLASFARQMTR